MKTKDFRIRTTIFVTMILMAVAFVAGIFICVTTNDIKEGASVIANQGIALFGIAICMVFLYSSLVDKMSGKKGTMLACISAIIGFSFFLDILNASIAQGERYRGFLSIGYTLEYINLILIVFAFWYFIYAELEEKRKKLNFYRISINILTLLNIVISILNIPFKFLFYIDESGNPVRNGYEMIVTVCSIYIFVIICICIIKSNTTKREKTVLFSFEIFPFIATLFYAFGFKYSLIYPSYLLSVLLIYIEFYERRQRKITEQETMITKQNLSLLISQIQPHFIYNTLTTISNLCTKNPEEAEETTVLFSQYLRRNLDSLSNYEPIDFAKEMDHVLVYTELEKKRFKDKLNVITDIKDTDFKVPALSLQPIVENSIKHGICAKNEPGTVTISSQKTKDGHLVIIEDDGVGFDVNAPMVNDGKAHVGLNNVRNRLKELCDANMDIISSPQNGCKTMILFPSKEN